jgi:transcriptional regulator with XRE-family HTH domain
MDSAGMHQEPDIKALWAMAKLQGVLWRSGVATEGGGPNLGLGAAGLAVTRTAGQGAALGLDGSVNGLASDEARRLNLAAAKTDQSGVVHAASLGDSTPGARALEAVQGRPEFVKIEVHAPSLCVDAADVNRRQRINSGNKIGAQMDACENLIRNIALLMREANPRLTQKAVADKMGVNQTSVGRIIAGQHTPTLSNLQALAKGFGLEAYQLLLPDLGRRIQVDSTGLSPVAIRLAEKFDKIPSLDDKRKAFAYIVQVLDFAAFNDPASAASPPSRAAKPAPARTRKTRRESNP